MPTFSARLDSSPVHVPTSPPRARPQIKRSASVASSLPTPPRTAVKRKRTRSLHEDDPEPDSHSDSDDAPDVNEKLSREAEEEEAFWLGQTQSQAAQSQDSGADADAEGSQDNSNPLLYRRIQQANSQTNILPVSPPPSHRKPKQKKARLGKALALARVDEEGPSTPPPKRRKLDFGLAKPQPKAERDDANNPFLATPLAVDSDDEVELVPDDVASAPKEKPTMTLVFRGVKREFPNPYFEETTNPNSLLPPEHEDYEPDERTVRKLLFKVKKKSTSAQKSGTPTRRAVDVARGRSAQDAPKAAASRNRIALKAASHKQRDSDDDDA